MKTIDELLLTHKQCKKCGIYYSFDCFHRHAKRKDGLRDECKTCHNDIENIRREAIRSNPQDHERDKLSKRIHYSELVKNPEFIEKQKQRSKLYNRRDYKSSPPDSVKYKARYLLANAILKGEVIKKPCEVCGEVKSEGHHEDYSKPYDVIWLCRTHHMELHRKHPRKN